uniref:cation transporter n=1 Tax=Listeria monocytogenes TaxID=1639 RepID=UPI0029166579
VSVYITGVENIEIDMMSSKVTVKGKVDPLKLRERVQKKSGRKTELISPLPKPNEENKAEEKETKAEEKKVTEVSF